MKILNSSEALVRLLEDRDLYVEVCEIFLDETPKLLGQIELEVSNGESSEEITSLFHSIRGAAANIGAEMLADLAAKMELKVKGTSSPGSVENQDFLELKKLNEATLVQVREFLKSEK